MKHGRLQHSAKGRRLFWVAVLASRKLLDRPVEVIAQLASEAGQVDTACLENTLGIRIVRQGKEQVFEREVRVTASDRLAEGDVKDSFNGGRKHVYRLLQASSIVARKGYPASWASDATVSALVSAISNR